MSPIVFQSGCATGSHKITCGSSSNGAITPNTGVVLDCSTSSSELTIARVND